MSMITPFDTPVAKAAITSLFEKGSPILIEVRFPKQGASPDWYLCEDEEEFDAIMDRLGANTETYLHSVWDLKNQKEPFCLKR